MVLFAVVIAMTTVPCIILTLLYLNDSNLHLKALTLFYGFCSISRNNRSSTSTFTGVLTMYICTFTVNTKAVIS